MVTQAEPWRKTAKTVLFYLALGPIEAYYFGPGIALYKYFQNKREIQHLPTFQICTNLLNCILWAIYAGKDTNPDDPVLKYVCNITGGVFSLVWVLLLWIVYSKENIKQNGIYLFTIYNVIFQIIYVLKEINTAEKASKIIWLNFMLNVGMYLTALQHVFTAFKESNTSLIPIFDSIGGFFAAFFFTLYGIVDQAFDLNLIANAASLVGLIVIIVLWLILYKKSKRKKDLKIIDERSLNIMDDMNSIRFSTQ